MASAIEAMQPLMNMITFTARSRAEIIGLHQALLDALEARNAAAIVEHLASLEAYTKALAHSVFEEKRSSRAARASDEQVSAPS